MTRTDPTPLFDEDGCPTDAAWDDVRQHMAEIGPDPGALASSQIARARQWLTDARSGIGVRWFLPTLHHLTGTLFPGWTVFVGGYPKCGKTTLLQTQARQWAEGGIPVAYIGTETSPEILRLQSVALTLGLPVRRVVGDDPLTPEESARIAADLSRQDGLPLHYAETTDTSLASVLYWLRWGAREGAQVVIFDHAHRLAISGGDYYQQLSNAIRTLNTAAQAANVTLLCAAQFRENKHDKLANFEPPADNQWFGSAAFQQEGHVCLQLWRPLRRGVTEDQKRMARSGETDLGDVLARDTIGVRCSAHRIKGDMIGEMRRLRIRDDYLDEWPVGVGG